MAVNEIKVGHKYNLSMESMSLTFSGGIDIQFRPPFPTYNSATLVRIYQKFNETTLYYEDNTSYEGVFGYPMSIDFIVQSVSNSTVDFLGSYLTEIYCPKLITSLGMTHDDVDIPYGESTTIQFYLEDGYKFPSNITVNGATYTWDSTTGALTVTPLPTTLVLTIIIVPISLLTITVNNDNSYLENNQKYIDSGETYTNKIIAGAGYVISNVVVTMGGTELTNVYDENTHVITINNVSGNIEITITTALDDSQLTIYTYRNNAEKNRVNKNDYLIPVDTITGTFRNSTNIINPVIEIEYDGVPDFNYIYINQLRRYYYVDSITSLVKNLWQIRLSIDVLMTYAPTIKTQTAHISRQENVYDENLLDIKRSMRSDVEYQIEEIETTVFDVDKTGTTWGGVDRNIRFVLTIVGDDN